MKNIKLKLEFQTFLVAVSFFTRIPIKHKTAIDEKILCNSLKYLPIIGWLVGAIQALIFFITQFVLPINVCVILALLTGLLLTGGLHEDGFIDVCDGHGGNHLSRQEILRIMQDSRVGAFGLIGYVGLFLLKFELLIAIAGQSYLLLMIAFVAAQSLSRLLIFVFIVQNKNMLVDCCNKSNFVVATKFTALEIFFAVICGLMPLLFFKYAIALLLILVLYVVERFLSKYFNKWLCGYTGDCLGSAQQVAEVMFYLAFIILHRFM